MLANKTATALLATGSLLSMLANCAATALLATAPLLSMLANSTPSGQASPAAVEAQGCTANTTIMRQSEDPSAKAKQEHDEGSL